MESDNAQDLPDDILEKLRDLELELEDGDITLKGFEKKKASLLADVSNPGSPISPTNQKSETEILAELGPEPSAADVVDFLDFLPSPTHSPTRTVEAVNHMEENHRQMQQQQQQQKQQQQQQQQQHLQSHQQQQQQQQYYQLQQPQPQHQHQHQHQHQQYQQLQPQPRPWPQQQQHTYQPPAGTQYINPQQQQQMRPMQYQFRPGGGIIHGSNAGPYYGNTSMGSPLPNNRPYVVHNNYPQQQPQMMRPGPNTFYGQRPTTTSPRPQPRPNGAYRPRPHYNGQLPPQPQLQQQQHGNYYSNPGAGVGVNRSPSGNMNNNNNMVKQYDQQQRQ